MNNWFEKSVTGPRPTPNIPTPKDVPMPYPPGPDGPDDPDDPDDDDGPGPHGPH